VNLKELQQTSRVWLMVAGAFLWSQCLFIPSYISTYTARCECWRQAKGPR
jgi:hypothetical protein